jgi:hypothetical protein
MDQSMSRPHRWRMAISRTRNAMSDIRDLQYEMQELLEQMQNLQGQIQQLRDQAKDPLSEFESAIVDLICLQGEYDCWTVPDNLSESRLQEKINKVTFINFDGLRKDSSELETLDLEYAAGVLEEAEQCSLPKGYGRD